MTSRDAGVGTGPAGECPPEARLRALLEPDPPADEDLAALVAHLEVCEPCRRRLDDVAAGEPVAESFRARERDLSGDNPEVLSAAMQALRRSPPPAPAEPDEDPVDFLEPGAPPGYLGKLGAYNIVSIVGRGGMGIVLKAHDPSLDRIVAIKVLSPVLAASSSARRRFVREARAAAAVSHEHVVTIHAVDEGGAGGARLPFLVMQFVSGRSLEARLRATGPLRLEEILRIGMQTAAGLAAAHAQGLVHRDVKPANIMLENGVERVKLTDFGLARAADDAEVTLTGQVTGTPHYMSPEHARGERVDPRSDLFSLGGVLYALCTGRPPFGGSGPLSTLRKVCEEEPALIRNVNEEIPAWLADYVAALMRKDPSGRPKSAAAVAEYLGQQLARLQHPATRPDGVGRVAGGRRVLRPLRAAVSVVLLVLAIAAALAARSGAFRGWFAARPIAARSTTSDTVPSASAPTVFQWTAAAPVFILTDAGDAPGRYSSLADAVAASPAGGTIEIAHDGRIEIPPLDLGGKPLRIRAAKGSRPVLVQSPRFEPILTTSGPLVLEGLEFQAAPGRPDRLPAGEEGGPCLVQVSRGPLYATHCRFAVRGVPRLRAGCVRLSDCAICEVRDTELYSLRGIAVQWLNTPDQAALKLDNVVVATRMVVVVQKPAKRTASVAVNRGTLYSGGLVTAHPSYEPAGLSVDLADNVLVIGAILFDPEAERMPGRLDDVPVAVRQTVLERIVSSEFDAAVARPAAATDEPDDPPATAPASAPAGKSTLDGLLEARVQFTGEPRAKVNRGEMPAAREFDVQSIRVPGRGTIAPRRLSSVGAEVDRVGPGGPFDDFRATQAYAQWQRRTAVTPPKSTNSSGG